MSENNEELSQHSKDEIQKTIDRDNRIKSIITELNENESVQNYLSNYSEYCKEDFISSYARMKSSWIEWGPMYAQLNLDKASQWADEAWKCLEIIQQKKLFDAQCLWRAEKVTYKEIEISFDFKCWENNVLNCPFIDPVDEDDIQLFQKFLLSLNAETSISFWEAWQDYDEIKEAYNGDESNRNFPEWYDFYNTYRGTTAYLLLPNTRGEKEEFYADLARKKRHEKFLKENPNLPKPDNKPFISPYQEFQLLEFMNLFETNDIKQLHKEYERGNNKKKDYDFNYTDLMFKIEAIEEPMPIEAHQDYKIALYYAYQKYCNQKIAEYLPVVLEQYEMNKSIGIGQQGDAERWLDIRRVCSELIIEGRVLNGEQPNFEF